MLSFGVEALHRFEPDCTQKPLGSQYKTRSAVRLSRKATGAKEAVQLRSSIAPGVRSSRGSSYLEDEEKARARWCVQAILAGVLMVCRCLGSERFGFLIKVAEVGLRHVATYR
jgi:hypothetical protein